MLGHKRIPSCEGGIEVVVKELSTRMVKKGYEVTCYNRSGHHVSGKEFDGEKLHNYKGVKLKSVLTIKFKGLAAITSSFFGAICCAFSKYDVVHFHAEGPAFMCWLPKLFGKKVVVTVHGLDHQRAKWGKLASAYIMMGERNAVKYADEIIVLSTGVQQYFLKTYNRQTCFIPNGVIKADLREADDIKKQWGLEKNGYILYLGRIVPEKGERYLIDAFKQVKTDKKLVIAGGSSDTDRFLEELKEAARGDDRIVFTGFVEGKVKQELFSNAYIYTLPSDLEGMPLSLLEAMSYGNCCLVSDIPECVDVVENNGVIFKKSDASDLRDKLQMLCDDSNLVQKYKNEATEFIMKKYNWDEVVDKTIALYSN
ncbi:MAG: glycosyltransferase family 4 protein [Acutalibacteraceae bacterium]